MPPTHSVPMLPPRYNTAVRWSTLVVLRWLLLISHRPLWVETLPFPHLPPLGSISIGDSSAGPPQLFLSIIPQPLGTTRTTTRQIPVCTPQPSSIGSCSIEAYLLQPCSAHPDRNGHLEHLLPQMALSLHTGLHSATCLIVPVGGLSLPILSFCCFL